MKKKLVAGILMAALTVSCLTGCEGLTSEVNDLNGSITGNTYNASFYTNEGEKFMDMSGQKIDLDSNIVKEETYSDGSGGYTKKISSVVTVTIDGKEVENCGTTMIFAEKELNPDVDFQSPEVINSKTDGSLGENVMIASVVNRFKNYFGKARVVVIQSQLGDPICAYSGDSVYYEVCEDLPKTTKLIVDGKALYIHRANFQIIDKELLN